MKLYFKSCKYICLFQSTFRALIRSHSHGCQSVITMRDLDWENSFISNGMISKFLVIYWIYIGYCNTHYRYLHLVAAGTPPDLHIRVHEPSTLVLKNFCVRSSTCRLPFVKANDTNYNFRNAIISSEISTNYRRDFIYDLFILYKPPTPKGATLFFPLSKNKEPLP